MEKHFKPGDVIINKDYADCSIKYLVLVDSDDIVAIDKNGRIVTILGRYRYLYKHTGIVVDLKPMLDRLK